MFLHHKIKQKALIGAHYRTLTRICNVLELAIKYKWLVKRRAVLGLVSGEPFKAGAIRRSTQTIKKQSKNNQKQSKTIKS